LAPAAPTAPTAYAASLRAALGGVPGVDVVVADTWDGPEVRLSGDRASVERLLAGDRSPGERSATAPDARPVGVPAWLTGLAGAVEAGPYRRTALSRRVAPFPGVDAAEAAWRSALLGLGAAPGSLAVVADPRAVRAPEFVFDRTGEPALPEGWRLLSWSWPIAGLVRFSVRGACLRAESDGTAHPAQVRLLLDVWSSVLETRLREPACGGAHGSV
jgi:hypothetical protein